MIRAHICSGYLMGMEMSVGGAPLWLMFSIYLSPRFWASREEKTKRLNLIRKLLFVPGAFFGFIAGIPLRGVMPMVPTLVVVPQSEAKQPMIH